ncbi:hypothetical protein QUF56_13975 [Ureibacillus composti]|nr:hypothetical protein [Ureibacillus composti]
MNSEMLQSFEGQVIQVDRHGPHTVIGKLLYVGDDFFVLLTKKDGVVFFQTHHVKSVTTDSKDPMEFDVYVDEDFEFHKGKKFKDICGHLIHHWVKINPEKIEGVMDGVCDDYVTIIKNKEIIYVNLFHIRNMNYGLMAPEEDNENEGNSGNSENSNSNGRSRRRRRNN